MASPAEFMLAALKAKYEAQEGSGAFSRLYEDDDEFGHMFSVLHKQLNQHFDDINDCARSTRHYWAENSRNLIKLIHEINDDLNELKAVTTGSRSHCLPKSTRTSSRGCRGRR